MGNHMGKQIYYWMEYQDFISIADAALDLDCVIIRDVVGKVEYGKTVDIVSENVHQYYFLPLSMGIDLNDKLDLTELRATCQVIEAGFSYINHEKKKITRSRIYVGTGYFDKQGDFINRSDVLTKVHNSLVRSIKKIAPYTELIDSYISTKEETYLQQVEYKHKEYITAECLKLKETEDYKLKV